MAKGTTVISANFAITQGINAVRMKYNCTRTMPPAVIVVLIVDTSDKSTDL